MIAVCFLAAAIGIGGGWISGNAAMLILGFWVGLIGFGLVLARDCRTNHAVVYDLDYARSRRLGARRDDAA